MLVDDEDAMIGACAVGAAGDGDGVGVSCATGIRNTVVAGTGGAGAGEAAMNPSRSEYTLIELNSQ